MFACKLFRLIVIATKLNVQFTFSSNMYVHASNRLKYLR